MTSAQSRSSHDAPAIASASSREDLGLLRRVLSWFGESGATSKSWALGGLKLLGVLLCVGGYLRHALHIRHLFRDNACDDAFISFRYLRLLVDHGELAYNLGERVEGYSNLLWILLLVPLDLAGLDPVLASQVLGMALGVTIILVGMVCVRTQLGCQSYIAQLSVGALLASSGFFASWSVMGLESMLHGSLLICAWLCFMRELAQPKARAWSAWALGALVMTRPEGLLVAGGALAVRVAVDAWRRQKGQGKPSWEFYAVLLGLIAAFEIFRVSYFGWHLWPNAVRAKVGGNTAQYLRGLEYVSNNFLKHYIYLLVPLFGVGKWLADRPARSAGAVLFAGYLAFYAMAGGDWSVGRFFAPLMGVGVMAFACVIDDLVSGARRKTQLLSGLVAFIAVGFLGYYSYRGSSEMGEQKFAGGFAGLDARRVEFGRWIAENTPPDTKVALYAAGQIAYHADRYAHDMLGLNDAHIAAIKPKGFGKGPAGHEKFDVEYTLNTIRPTIIVQPWLIPGLMDHKDFRARYEVLPPFQEAWVLRDYWKTHKK